MIASLDKSKFAPYVLCCADLEENKKIFESVGASFIGDRRIGPWHGSTVSGMSASLFLHNVKHALPTIESVKGIVQSLRPDIVHLNSTSMFLAAKAVKAVDEKIPVICHVREPLLPGLWGDILRRGCEKYVDQYVAIQHHDAASLGKTKHPVEQVYNSVDLPAYSMIREDSGFRRELGIANQTPLMLYLARVSPENGVLELLNNMEVILKTYSTIHLVVVGADLESNSSYLRSVRKVANAFPDNVTLLGFRHDVQNMIASSDFIIVPFTEPHSARTVIEASAMGVPAIGTDVGGVNELIIDGRTGLLYELGNTQQFLQKLGELVNHQDIRLQLGKNAKDFAMANFDASKNTKRIERIYKRLLNE